MNLPSKLLGMEPASHWDYIAGSVFYLMNRIERIEEKFGEPDGWIGSGILWPVYVLEDGSAVELVFKGIMICEDLEAVYLYKGGEEFVLKEK